MADFAALVSEGPFSFVAVGEGDVCVGAALEDDGLAGLVEDLAAGGGVADAFADVEFDGGEGAVG